MKPYTLEYKCQRIQIELNSIFCELFSESNNSTRLVVAAYMQVLKNEPKKIKQKTKLLLVHLKVVVYFRNLNKYYNHVY